MQTKWDSIIQKNAVRNHTTPRKDDELTLEEFLDYLSQASSGKL